MRVQRLGNLIVPVVLVLFACAKTGEKSQPSTSERLTPQVTETELSPSGQALLESYRSNQPLDAAKLRDAIYSNHLAIYEKLPAAVAMKNEDLEGFFQDLGKGAPPEVLYLKPHYEKKLSEIFKADMDYDKTAVTLAHIKETNAMQCYSGTMMLAIESLIHTPSKDRANLVVIIETGHLLIGKVTEDAGQYYLNGIETTAGGRALVSYGLLKKVTKYVRVVDLELFLLIDSLKYALKNSMEVSNQALRITGAKYGVSEVFLLTEEPFIEKSANYTPFQFGTSSVPDGRSKRRGFDLLDRSELSKHVPGLFALPTGLVRAFNPNLVADPFRGKEELLLRLTILQRQAASDRGVNVVIDKRFAIAGWPAMVTVSDACERYYKEIESPGEISHELYAKVSEFLDTYSPRPTGERTSSP